MVRFLRAASLFLLSQVMLIPLMASLASAEGILPKRAVSTSEFVAAPEFKWAGVYFDLGVGGQAALSDLSARVFELDGPASAGGDLNGLGAWDFVGNARIGFNIQPSGSPLVFGAFVGYSVGSVDIDGSIFLDDGTVKQEGGLRARFTPTWDAGALIGIVGPGKSLFYGGYRYQMVDFDLRGTGLAETPVDSICQTFARCSDSVGGHGFILGMKMPITPALILGVEYGYTRLDDIELSRVEGVSARLEPELHTVMLRGTVLLGPNLFGN